MIKNKKSIYIFNGLFLGGLIIYMGFMIGTSADHKPIHFHLQSLKWNDTNNSSVSISYFKTGFERLPSSLAGTQVPGPLHADINGNLIITHILREVFDYFLSAESDESISVIHDRILAYLVNNLPTHAAYQAGVILEDYLNYKKALINNHEATQGKSSANLEAIQNTMSNIKLLRSSYFLPEVITAFFGNDDIYNQYILAREAIVQNKTLSLQEKTDQLNALTYHLPAPMSNSIHETQDLRTMNNLTQQAIQQGQDSSAVHQIRAGIMGNDVADRFDAVDKEQNQFSTNLKNYIQQKQIMEDNTSLADTDKAAMLQQLKSNLFGAQAGRVTAIENSPAAIKFILHSQ